MNTNKCIVFYLNDRIDIASYTKFFRNASYDVIFVNSQQSAFDNCINKIIDVVVLEIDFTKENSFLYLKRIRMTSKRNLIYCIIRGYDVDRKIKTLENGADDCLTFPFSKEELLARINAQYRRHFSSENVFKNGDLTIKYDSKNIYIKNKEVHFTTFEFKILSLLSQNLGKSVEDQKIISSIWGEEGADINTVRVFMTRIRKKIAANSDQDLIFTDVGFGYRMNQITSNN